MSSERASRFRPSLPIGQTVGAKPLGDYRVEALLAMLGRAGDLTVETLELPEIADFYA